MKQLRATGVSVRFDQRVVLDDVSVELLAGRATILVGPNGAGKSTLIKVLLGLVRPDAGRFELDGAAAGIDNDWKRRVGYLPEAVAFSENLSGRQLLHFFASARGVEQARVEAVLERVGLRAAARRGIRGYSRGMRQRLGLGVAILATPQLLILDEPTSGLDQQGLSVLWSVLEEWREAGRIVLAATHDLALMERRTDDVCVLHEGRVLARGRAEELRHAVKLPQLVWLELTDAGDPQVDALCEALRRSGTGRVELVDERLRIELPSDEFLDVMRVQGGFPGVVCGVRVEEPTLDLVYDALLESS